jgi:hypothetical protein
MTKNSDRDDFYEAYTLYYLVGSGRLSCLTSRDSLREIGLFSKDELLKNRWHHLVMAFDNEHLVWYIDGKLENSTPKNFELAYNEADSVLLGSTGSKKNERYLCGVVDDVEFYDKVLTGEEVLDLYHAPNPNKSKIVLNWLLMGLGGIGLLVGLYYYVQYRTRINVMKERQQMELTNKMLETDLRVNRALMNPHFIFNSLNSLQNFILKNENDQANYYLVKFSKLMRNMLDYNSSGIISLEAEIDTLTRYVELENLRFEKGINYAIHLDPLISPSAIHIPVMLIQPFVENAIWHGLLKKDGNKELNISFSLKPPLYIECIVEDNGVGRQKTNYEMTDKRSRATDFIMQRLSLINKISNLECSLAIEDKPGNSGTIVKIIIPIQKQPIV